MNDFTWSELGQRLKDWRIAAGMTQRGLSVRVGLSQPAIQAIEAGTTNPQLNSLQRLASALGKSTRELMLGQHMTTDPRVERLERVLRSGHELAITAAKQGLTCAEALLEKLPHVYIQKGHGGFRRTISEREAKEKGLLDKMQPEYLLSGKASRYQSRRAPEHRPGQKFTEQSNRGWKESANISTNEPETPYRAPNPEVHEARALTHPLGPTGV
jgi:transcriptional regulator with XRE-family HTH domain